jgi:cob(I)alamin adenosyltransferase
VVLSRIYTRTGDDGTTALGDGSRVAKTDSRLYAYADVDEANCAIGLVLALGHPGDDIAELLIRIQNELFDVGADLCKPITEKEGQKTSLRIDGGYITRLEQSCDLYNEHLSTLRSFVLPGGTATGALFHHARTVVRRAERSAWAAAQEYTDSVNPLSIHYLNRLSDLLFILARQSNAEIGDLLWKPGGDRS